MKTIQNILLCGPFVSVVVVALAGCLSEPAAPAKPEEIRCDKLAECGKLSEGVEAEQCAVTMGLLHDQAVKELDVCTPVFQRIESLIACAAQQEGCESDVGMEAADLPQDHPCFEENESYKRALQEVGDQRHEPDTAALCVFFYERAMELATTPATGKACTTSDDCPDVECPDPALGRHGYCQSGKCKTAIDICG
ncbi:hypothetical protein WME97_18715 [Sorangium sp. So ce367]|uniref:hypothetical protein n=1 Tax=Sorangium sp. So ce367 TaxID=3133305 RepID=UPI003F5E9EB3